MKRQKYGERTVAKAVHMLAVCASNADDPIHGVYFSGIDYVVYGKFEYRAWGLAHRAMCEVTAPPCPLDEDWLAERYAEAEALLRTGWRPQ